MPPAAKTKRKKKSKKSKGLPALAAGGARVRPPVAGGRTVFPYLRDVQHIITPGQPIPHYFNVQYINGLQQVEEMRRAFRQDLEEVLGHMQRVARNEQDHANVRDFGVQANREFEESVASWSTAPSSWGGGDAFGGDAFGGDGGSSAGSVNDWISVSRATSSAAASRTSTREGSYAPTMYSAMSGGRDSASGAAAEGRDSASDAADVRAPSVSSSYRERAARIEEMLAEARGADAAAQRRMDNISRIRSEGAAAPEAQEDTAAAPPAAPPAAQPPPAPAHSPAAFRRRGYFEGRAPHTAPPPQAPPQPPAAPPPQPPQAPMSEFSFRTEEQAPGRVSPAATSRNASGELPPAAAPRSASQSTSSPSRQEEVAEALAAQGMPEMRAQQQANLESHIARQREEWARNYQANVDAYLAQQQQEHAAAYAFAPQAPSVSMSEVSSEVVGSSIVRGHSVIDLTGAPSSAPGYNNIHNVWSSASSSPRGSVSGAVPAASRRSRSRSPPVSDAQVEAVFGPAPAPLNGLPLASAMARQVFGGEAVAAAEGLPLASAAAREVFGQRRRRRPASWRSHTSSVVETGGARNEVLLPGMEAVFGPVEPILDDMRRARTTGQAALDRLNAAIARGAVPAYGGGAGGAVPP